MGCSYKHGLDGLYRVFRNEGPMKMFNGATLASSRAVLVTIGQVGSTHWHSHRICVFTDCYFTDIPGAFQSHAYIMSLARDPTLFLLIGPRHSLSLSRLFLSPSLYPSLSFCLCMYVCLYLYLYDRLDQRRFDVMTRVPV